MILSMTGYGRGNGTYNNKAYVVEVKSLNSKNTDIRVKIPANLSDKEFSIRKMVQDGALRGRIEVIIGIEGESSNGDFTFNAALFKTYYEELSKITVEMGIEKPDIFAAVMRIPAVVNSGGSIVSEEEWEAVQALIEKALKGLESFRIDEGFVLAQDLGARVANIKDSIPKIAVYEQTRAEKLKEKLKKNFEDFFVSEKVDQNRFEQEVLYYLERIDITEEKVRLAQHCEYFMSQLNSSDTQVGKILNFISQEMGREINTLGSKAQDSDMQQIVVFMKDELEKIKEQLANIL